MKKDKIHFISNKTDLNPEKTKKGFDRDIIKEHSNHFRFDKRFAGVKRGTSLFKNGEIIPGFPKIRRALTLTPTLEKRFGDKVAVEEKMNGYNVRITEINDEIIGLTRSGLICPYTTAKAKEKINKEFFKEHPKKFICGEMVGPDNPYVPTEIYDVKSLDFRVFDIRKKDSGKRLPIKERRKICTEFGINNVKLFSIIKTKNSLKKIKEIIKELGEKNREGIVIKDPSTDLEPIKYTTSQGNCKDLEFAYRYYHDYGNDFVYSRTVREGFQSYEWNENKVEMEKRAKRIGMNILKPMKKTIKERDKNKRITETVKIKVKNLELAKEFLNHLNKQGIPTEVAEINKLDNEFRVIIDKLQKSTNDKTKQILDGGVW